MMMGRIYSGNLNDYKDVVARLQEDHDVTVKVESFSYENPAKMCRSSGEVLRVFTRSGHLVASRTFEHSDSDVQINAQTAWLRKIHSDLKHWK
ncbi:deoxyguanosine triphospho-hydrolase inhibitor [Serratia phage SALSA]|uniref:Deoxyguanosine triphospho-hydrolase inhibitor n=1 Tax=Serratia phage SALSA TaxID=2736256 RepID=A0A7G9UTN9_9CAUD|nr:deoxyguanosine triphospho-hydrolase inhibitor [Serratia phage SALSA]